MTRTDLLSRAQHLRSQRTPFVLATVVRAQRPTSAKAGDTALVLPDGTLDGFVGGTCAEATVRLQGLRLLATGRSMLLRITPEPEQTDEPADEPAEGAAGGVVEGAAGGAVEGLVTVANPCLSGGALEIFLEAMIPPTLVHVFGDGPIARAMAGVGEALGYHITTTTDPGPPIPTDAGAVVVASHGRDEERVLTGALRAGVPYIALVASRRRAAAVLGGLDLAEQERARVHAPAGLDIGARTPPEVALSILAEIIASRPGTPTPPAPRLPAEDSIAPQMVESALTGPTASSQAATAVDVSDKAGGVSTGSAPRRPLAARDPVCGMEVAITPTALRLEHAGSTWYFCGSGCRTAFADAPERYLTDG